MQKRIAQIWNGALEPARTSGADNRQVLEMAALMERNCERLKEKLALEALEIFERYCECAEEYASLLSEQAFCDRFSLGARITAEAMLAPHPEE